MDAAQVAARLRAIEEERRRLLQEQHEQEAEGEAEQPNALASGSTTTRRELWALAREMMQAAAENQEEGAAQQQKDAGDDEEAENLPTLREAVRLVEGIGMVAALTPPATLLSAGEGNDDGDALITRLPALVDQHLAARARLEALLEAEQRATRPRIISQPSPSQRLLAALLRLVRGQARALRERALWAARHQALSFPAAPAQDRSAAPVSAVVVVASLYRRPRPPITATTAGLLPLFLALERLQAASAGSPLPLTVTEDPRERRRAASPRSPRGGAGGSSLGPPPSQLDRLLAGIAHALVDRAVLPALHSHSAAAADFGVSLQLTTGPGPDGRGEIMSLCLGPGAAAAQEGHGDDGGRLGAAMAVAEAAAGFVCEGMLGGEPWWTEEDKGGAHRRPLLAPLVDPLVAALGEAVADGLLHARPQDDEAARALLRPLLPSPSAHHSGQQGESPREQQPRRSLALQRFLERVAVRALSSSGPDASVGTAAAAVSMAGPFNVREAHARAWALGRSQELLQAGLSLPTPMQRQKKRGEEEDAAGAWRGLLQEACAAPGPAVAPPALLACIPREVAALAAALGNNAPAAAAVGEGGGLSPGRRQEEGGGGVSSLSPQVRKGLAEALLAFGHRQGRAQQQLQGGAGGRDWAAVDVALKLY